MNVSLVIPSRNNLKYVKFSYESVREYLPPETEVILLDDASTDGTWDWMKSVQGPKTQIFRNEGPDRVGHTVLYDQGATMATNEVFGIFHADMVASLSYIPNMVKHLKRGTVVSATRIEPPLHPPGPEKIVQNFGLEPEEFNTKEFLKFVETQESNNKDKTSEGIFAPWMMYKEDFFAIGGHDKRVFAPMELEDSDLFNRFLLKGYTMIQSRDALVYHFTCRGSRFKDGVKIIQEIPLGGGHVWKRPQDSFEYSLLRQIKFREWWRKWHMNVLHDENMKPKVCKRYDIGYLVHIGENDKLEQLHEALTLIEPWSDTLYLDFQKFSKLDQKGREKISSYYKRTINSFIDHINNHSFNKETNSNTRVTNFDLYKRIKLYEGAVDNNITLEFNILDFKQEHYKFIEELMFIIEDSGEVGEFEHDIFKFTIKSMESYEDKLIHADDPWYLEKLS